jgi:hypothetical protein
MSHAENLRSVARGIEVSWRDDDMTGWTDPIRAAAAHIERLEEALRWYADRENYDNQIAISRGDGTCDYSLPVLEDEGRIARAALSISAEEEER